MSLATLSRTTPGSSFKEEKFEIVWARTMAVCFKVLSSCLHPQQRNQGTRSTGAAQRQHISSVISEQHRLQGLAQPLPLQPAMCGLPFAALAAAFGLSEASGYFQQHQAVNALGSLTASSSSAGVLPLVEFDNSVMDVYASPTSLGQIHSILLARVAPPSVCVVSATTVVPAAVAASVGKKAQFIYCTAHAEHPFAPAMCVDRHAYRPNMKPTTQAALGTASPTPAWMQQTRRAA